METKYKILLGLYAAFMAYFMLVVPWTKNGGTTDVATAFILSPPFPGNSIDIESVVFRVVVVSIIFGGIYFALKKLTT